MRSHVTVIKLDQRARSHDLLAVHAAVLRAVPTASTIVTARFDGGHLGELSWAPRVDAPDFLNRAILEESFFDDCDIFYCESSGEAASIIAKYAWPYGLLLRHSLCLVRIFEGFEIMAFSQSPSVGDALQRSFPSAKTEHRELRQGDFPV
ncbi:MAG: hypothetical protein VYC34_01140 [Planctomycetota bacterium]|nr:hypothetical protein [Planctomycetota bacterium]